MQIFASSLWIFGFNKLPVYFLKGLNSASFSTNIMYVQLTAAELIGRREKNIPAKDFPVFVSVAISKTNFKKSACLCS